MRVMYPRSDAKQSKSGTNTNISQVYKCARLASPRVLCFGEKLAVVPCRVYDPGVAVSCYSVWVSKSAAANFRADRGCHFCYCGLSIALAIPRA